MRVVISSANLPTWKAFVQISKNISQHSCFYLKPDGIYTQGMDSSQTSLYDAWFPRDWFAHYEYDPATDVPNIMVHTEHLTRVMASPSASAGDGIGICLEVSPNKARLVVSVLAEGGRKATVFEVQLLDIDAELVNVVSKDCSIHFTMSAKALYDLIHEHATFGEKTTFKCNRTLLAFVTWGEVCEKSYMSVERGDCGIADFEAESDYAYKLTYHTKQLERLLQFYKFCGANANARAHVSFDDDHPFTVMYKHVNTTDVSTLQANGDEGRTANVRIYLAPMIVTDPIHSDDEKAEHEADLLQEALGDADMITDD